MRKIEQQLIAAIRANKAFSGGNTVYDPETGIVRLYRTDIAKIENDKVAQFWSGHNSRTTQSRLNAILWSFGANSGVYTRNFEMRYKDSATNGGWMTV